MTTTDIRQQIDEIQRIHDDDPAQAAAGLAKLDLAQVPADRVARVAFLCNHVLGEKLQQWPQAVTLLRRLTDAAAASAEPPVAALRHLAIALGRAAAPDADAALSALAQALQVAPQDARAAIELAANEFESDPVQATRALARLAPRVCALAPGPLDQPLAATLNNQTTNLYYATRQAALSAELVLALRAGAQAAWHFWHRAGGWMEHERALYLCAKIGLRTHDLATALAAAEQGLALVQAHGDDVIERAFLAQLQAAALERSAQPARAAALRAGIAAWAATMEPSMRDLLAQDAAEFPRAAPLRIAFIGGGNMAAAMIAGLQRAGTPTDLLVVEPDAARRDWLAREHAVTVRAAADAALADCAVIVLAVKPQQMQPACRALRPYAGHALLLSIAAGIRAGDIARWTGIARIVRAMPNTPALIGAGISGCCAAPEVGDAERALAAQVLAAIGEVQWVAHEADLDAVTAVSGSGPAYVFQFIESVAAGGVTLGLPEATARRLAISTFRGAAELANRSDEPLAVLRERVTSKGGTTAAALARMQADRLDATIIGAVQAARARAVELGDDFGRDDDTPSPAD